MAHGALVVLYVRYRMTCVEDLGYVGSSTSTRVLNTTKYGCYVVMLPSTLQRERTYGTTTT